MVLEDQSNIRNVPSEAVRESKCFGVAQDLNSVGRSRVQDVTLIIDSDDDDDDEIQEISGTEFKQRRPGLASRNDTVCSLSSFR
jgi:hypothetical protein